MIPVDQDRFGPGVGNCFSAAVASILELPLTDVPFFMTGDDWYVGFQAWLLARGLVADYYPAYRERPDGYAILSGLSPRYEGVYHSVVALDGVLVHDPHPSRAGLLSTLDYIALRPVAP